MAHKHHWKRKKKVNKFGHIIESVSCCVPVATLIALTICLSEPSMLLRSRPRTGQKSNLPTTSVEVKTLTPKDQVLNPPPGSEEGRQPTRVVLDRTDSNVEIELTQMDGDQPKSKLRDETDRSDEHRSTTDLPAAAEDHPPAVKRHIGRMKLLKVRHHVNFLDACTRDDLLPKGMSLRLKVNVMEPTDDLPIAVNQILTTASRAIRDLVVNHYRNLLIRYESDLDGATPPNDDDDAHRQEMEQKETDFATRLADRRQRKLDTLRHPERQRTQLDRRPRPLRQRTRNTRRRRRPLTTVTSNEAKPNEGPDSRQEDSVRNTTTQNSHAHTAHTPTTQAPYRYTHTNRFPSRPPPPLTHTRTSLPPPPPPPPSQFLPPPLTHTRTSLPPPPPPPPSQLLPPPHHPPPVYPPPQVFPYAVPPAPPPLDWNRGQNTCYQHHPYGHSYYWRGYGYAPQLKPSVDAWQDHLPPPPPCQFAQGPPPTLYPDPRGYLHDNAQTRTGPTLHLQRPTDRRVSRQGA